MESAEMRWPGALLSPNLVATITYFRRPAEVTSHNVMASSRIHSLLLDAGISKGQLDNALQSVRGSGASVDTDTADQKFEALQKYGTDLTAKAAQLDPVIGRDEEIRRCVRILCRRTKNNPVLIGDPGTLP